jgi:ankyrin repeat protein
MVRALLQAVAQVDFDHDIRYISLMLAAELGHADTASLLLKAGAAARKLRYGFTASCGPLVSKNFICVYTLVLKSNATLLFTTKL